MSGLGEIVVITPQRQGKDFISLSLGFRFDMRVWLAMLGDGSEEKSIDLTNQDTVKRLFYFAHFSYCRSRGRACEVSEADMQKIFDDMPNKTASDVLQCLVDSKKGAGSLKDEIEKHYTTRAKESEHIKSKKKISLSKSVKQFAGRAVTGLRNFTHSLGAKLK